MGLFDWIELILDILENPKGCLITGLIIVLLCGGLSIAQTQKINPSIQERHLNPPREAP